MPTPWHSNLSSQLRLNLKTFSMTSLTGPWGLPTILQTGLSMPIMTLLIGLSRLSMTLVMPSKTLQAGLVTPLRTHTTGPKNLTTGKLLQTQPLVLCLLESFMATGKLGDMFTDSSNYYGDNHDDPEGCDPDQPLREHAEFCAAFDPKVNQPKPGSRYTITDDFNYELMKARVPFDSVYAPLGDISDPNHKMIEPRDCEDVDCMHPCYGKNQYGACGKCVSYLLENNGARH